MKQLNLFGDGPTLRQLWDQAPANVNPTVLHADVPRLTASLRRLWEHMRDGRWCTATELTAVAGRRYGGRLHELATAGIPHESERVSGGEW